MFPPKSFGNKDVKKGGGFGLINVLKQNEQLRITATPAK